ncbi:MAG: hypothetical protein ABSD31_21160 [Candidatus Binataceae bacterium]
MSFRTAISITAGADQVLAVYNHRLAQADFVMLAASATPSACPRRSCFRARRRGHHARVPCPNYQPLKRATFHAGSKHAEIVTKQAEIVRKRAKKLGKQLTGR